MTSQPQPPRGEDFPDPRPVLDILAVPYYAVTGDIQPLPTLDTSSIHDLGRRFYKSVTESDEPLVPDMDNRHTLTHRAHMFLFEAISTKIDRIKNEYPDHHVRLPFVTIDKDKVEGHINNYHQRKADAHGDRAIQRMIGDDRYKLIEQALSFEHASYIAEVPGNIKPESPRSHRYEYTYPEIYLAHVLCNHFQVASLSPDYSGSEIRAPEAATMAIAFNDLLAAYGNHLANRANVKPQRPRQPHRPLLRGSVELRLVDGGVES